MTTTTAPACAECHGEGMVYVPTCHGGSEHVGRHCRGLICGEDTVDCDHCNGTGIEPCRWCGEPADFTDAQQDIVCSSCYEESD